MKIALAIAESAKGTTSPNPSVGAVIVKNGKVISKGATQPPGMDHAEVQAIKKAGKKVKNSTIYISLEPCCFHGKTPPCTERIMGAGIKKVVIATPDLNPKVNGKGIEILKKKGIKVISGVFENKAVRINQDFFKYITTGYPFVIAKYASTLDGRIASSSYDSKWITNEKARKDVHKIRRKVDAIMVGAGTVLNDNPGLTARLGEKIYPRQRIILDTFAKISDKFNILNDEYPAIVFASKEHVNKEYASFFNNENKVLIPFAGEKLDWKMIMKELASREIVSLLIEGGSGVLGSAFQNSVVDEAVVYFAPRFSLGSDGIPPLSGKGVAQMKDALNLSDVRIKKFEDNVKISGMCIYTAKSEDK